MIFGGRKEGALLFIKECIWGTINAQFSFPFLSMYTYDFGGCKGSSTPLSEKISLRAKYELF